MDSSRDGCWEAFDESARRDWAGVSLIAQQILGDAGRAEDVAQEALSAACRALPTLLELIKRRPSSDTGA